MRGIQEYLDNIQKLIDATKQGKLVWKKQDATTFYFSRSLYEKVSIQLLTDTVSKFNKIYLLQIEESLFKQILLSIDSSIPELKDKLIELFDEVSYVIERKKGVDFFSNLTKNL